MSRFLVLLACLLGLLQASAARASGADFYHFAASDVAGPAGSIVRSEKLPTPAGASAAFRFLYRSRDHLGRPMLLSGVAAIPSAPPRQGGRPIVSWAHGTSGVAARCAPSMQAGVFGEIEGFGDLMAFGAIVVATDYHGLGAPGRTGYLVAASEAHAVIDAARAARDLPGAEAGRAFVAWGWSQGAHAALAAADVAGGYAPDLTLVGVAAAAPPTDLATLLGDDIATPAGQVLAAYAARSWSEVYGVSINTVLLPAARPTVASISGMCSRNWLEDVGLGLAALGNEAGGLVLKGATRRAPWRGLLEQNSVRTIPSRVPAFIAQGLRDTIIEADVTRAFVHAVCRSGDPVRYVEYPAADHGGTESASARAAIAWMRDRFNGVAAPNDCAKKIAASGPHTI